MDLLLEIVAGLMVLGWLLDWRDKRKIRTRLNVHDVRLMKLETKEADNAHSHD